MAIKIQDTGSSLKIIDNDIVAASIPKDAIVSIEKHGTDRIEIQWNYSGVKRWVQYSENIIVEPATIATTPEDRATELVETLQNIANPNEQPKITDEVSADLQYIGFANNGAATSDAAWAIMKVEKVGAITTIEWATAVRDRSNVWDDRTTLTYVQ
jgi:hypothetical protein